MTNILDLQKGNAKKAVILARVSSKEQEDGYSIEAQTYRLKSYCERRGLEIVETYEITESSTKGDRKSFMEMISFCKKQKQTIAIVADKIDRVQRSLKEYPVLDGLVQEGKIELHFISENYVIHKDSISQERLMWSIGIILAQSYVDSLRDNVKRSIDHKLRNGEFPSKAPIGYLNIRTDKDRGDVIVDETRALLIARLFKEFATGVYTLGHLADATKKWGLTSKTSGKPLSKVHLHKILTNPFYYGIMKVKGKELPHKYPALITKEIFDECQAVFKRWHKKKFAYGELQFPFRGLLTAKSNGRVVYSYTRKKTYKSGATAEWTYLRSWDDAGKDIHVRQDKILAQAEVALRALKIPSDVFDIVKDELRATDKVEREFALRQDGELKKEDSRIQSRLNSLLDLLLDGGITREEFDTRKQEFRNRQLEIKSQLEANMRGDDGFKESLLLILETCCQAGDYFVNATDEEKRKILNLVLTNLTLDNGTLCYSYRIPFSLFINTAEPNDWRPILHTVRTDIGVRKAVITIAKHIDLLKLATGLKIPCHPH